MAVIAVAGGNGSKFSALRIPSQILITYTLTDVGPHILDALIARNRHKIIILSRKVRD